MDGSSDSGDSASGEGGSGPIDKTISAAGSDESGSGAAGADRSDSGDSFSREYVEKLRREAAGYRARLKEAEPIVAEYEKQREAQKTELERAQERIAALEEEARRAEAQATRSRVAQAKGVPVDLLPSSGDAEELERVADELVSWAAKQHTHSRGLPRSGAAGTDTGGTSNDEMARRILGV